MTARKKRSRMGWYLLLLLAAGGLLAIYKAFGPATGTFTRGEYLYIHTGWNYDQVKQALEDGGFITDGFSFGLLADMAKLPAHIHPGKYKINPGMSNYHIIRLLHAGKQTPVRLVINKLRTRHDLVRLLSTSLEADSATLNQLLDSAGYLNQFGLDTNSLLCAVIPDTYIFYWNTGADHAFRKIERNYTLFWNNDRKQQAKAQGLTPKEAVTLASIVDEETNMANDKPNIASVYLNRLHKGMKLQADPTVRYAMGDFTIRRITGAMLDTTSFYNTYLYEGLPPGPICTPTVSSVEAVLEAPKTTYLYFCAKNDFSGYSVFATTYGDQLKNARAYQQALDARGIH